MKLHERELYEIIKKYNEIEKNEILNKINKKIYNLNIIENRIKNVEKEEYSKNYINGCKYIINNIIKKKYNIDIKINISYNKNNIYDYQCNDVFKISNKLNRNSNEIAKEICDELKLMMNNWYNRIEISGNGFINISLCDEIIKNYCKNIIINGISPPKIVKRKVVIDFSSPNFAKEMHVGHLRSTIIGDCLSRIFEFVNLDVMRINHVGDWGTQFGMLISYLEEIYPDYDKNIPNINDLEKFYKESKYKFDNDENFKRKSHETVVKLQNGLCDKINKGWKLICDISRKSHNDIYKKLNIKLIEMGESFYQSRMISLIDELEKNKLLVHDNNCKVIYVNGHNIPLMIVKSDGGFTYDTSDLATLKYRLNELNADWLLYVVDSGQREHFDLIFKFALNSNWYNPSINRIEHIGFGVVLGENNKKFKTRSGSVIKLNHLLDEAVLRCKNKLIEKGVISASPSSTTTTAESITANIDSNTTIVNDVDEDVLAKCIGYSCIRYAELSHNRTSDYTFSYDKMLDDRGNTAIYLLYIYTRLRSIIRKSNLTDEEIINYVRENEIEISNEKELHLLKKLIKFPEIITKIVYESYPHYLCDYLYELCCITSEYYDNCQIIYNNIPNMNRLAHIYATSLTLKCGFNLIGLTPLERM